MKILVLIGLVLFIFYPIMGIVFRNRRKKPFTCRVPVSADIWISVNCGELVRTSVLAAVEKETGIDRQKLLPTDSFESLRMPSLFNYDDFDVFDAELRLMLGLGDIVPIPALRGTVGNFMETLDSYLKHEYSRGFPILIENENKSHLG